MANPKYMFNTSQPVDKQVTASASTDGFNILRVTDPTGGITVTISSDDITNQLYPIIIQDTSGNCSAVNTITIQTQGSELIDGAASSLVIDQAYGAVALQTDGTDVFILQQPQASSASSVTAAGANQYTATSGFAQDAEISALYDGNVVTPYLNIAGSGLVTAVTAGTYFMQFNAMLRSLNTAPLATVYFYYRKNGALQYNDKSAAPTLFNATPFSVSRFTYSGYISLAVGDTINWFLYQPSAEGVMNCAWWPDGDVPFPIAGAPGNATSIKFWYIS